MHCAFWKEDRLVIAIVNNHGRWNDQLLKKPRKLKITEALPIWVCLTKEVRHAEEAQKLAVSPLPGLT